MTTMTDRFDAAVLRWDVARFLRQHSQDVNFTETGQAHCDHGSCAGKRLYVNMRSKLWICHKCGKKGNAIGLVQLFTRQSTVDAMKTILSASPARDAPEPAPRSAPSQQAVMHPNYHPLVMPETDKSRPFWDYVIDRGLSPSLVMKYKMGYIRTGDQRNRLVIPIYQGGELVGYTARSLVEGIKMKYWVPPWCHTSKMLFNLDALEGRSDVVLVEGQFDALRLPDRAVCTFGKKFSAEQIDLLIEAGVESVTLCYDADAAEAGFDFAGRVSDYMEVRKAKLPPGYDPGDAPMMELLSALRDAKPIDGLMHHRV